MGHKYYHDEPLNSACYINQNGQIMNASHYNLLAADIFYNLGLVVFIILTTYHACEDGSCSCFEVCNACCGILTCGLCYKKPNIDY